MNLLSLFSGCGGMDIGFEGGFFCLKKSVNREIHPEWIEEDNAAREITSGTHGINVNRTHRHGRCVWQCVS